MLALTVFVTDESEAQRDSVKVEHEVIVNSAGDTLVIIAPVYGNIRHGARQIRIEREVTINSDGDTTIIANVTRDPKVRMLLHSHGGQCGRRIRNRLEHRGRKRGREHHVHLEKRGSRELREVETEARCLARELREADEESHQEKEEN